MSDVYYKFKYIPDTRSSKYKADVSYTVFAENPMHLEMFLRQHNFGQHARSTIEKVSINELKEKDSLIKPFKFKSNKDSTIYNVFTTNELIYEMMVSFGNTITDFTMFGDAILREDIPIIKHINALLNEIPYIVPAEFMMLDEINDEQMYQSSSSYLKRIEYSESYLNNGYVDDMFVVDQLIQHFDEDKIVPITIEAYVKEFTLSVTDYYLLNRGDYHGK